MNNYKKTIEKRIAELEKELNSCVWHTLETYIKGKIDAYKAALKDIDEGRV